MISAFLTITVKAQKPNVLVILTDDQGWADIGYNNPDVYTPNMDALAAEGIQFTNNYSMPQCTPSRIALMTGRFPGRFGTEGLTATTEQVFPLGTTTMASVLKANGYETHTAGKWHMGFDFDYGPNNYGFDHSYGSNSGGIGMYDHRYRVGTDQEICWHRNHQIIPGYENGEHVTDLCTNDAINFIENYRDFSKPFLMYMAYNAPHTPLDERGQFVDTPTQLDLNNPNRWLNEDDIEWFHDPMGKIQSEPDPERRLYLAVLNHLDDAIGKIVTTLKNEGLYDNTIIIFSSDNGPQISWGGGAYLDDLNVTDFNPDSPYRGDKTDTYEGGILVPGFVVWPNRIAPRVEQDPVHLVDWLPTLRGIINDESAEAIDFDGQNLSCLLFNDEDLEERSLYFRRRNSQFSLQYNRWKIVREGVNAPLSASDWQLYNLDTDPYETNNVASSNNVIVQDLHQRYLQHLDKDLDFLNDFGLPDNIDEDNCDIEVLCPDFDQNLIGALCDDNDPCTISDIYIDACICAGTFGPDTDNDGTCDTQDQCPNLDNTLIGTSCDDGDICTIGDVYLTNCSCAGMFTDADDDDICDAYDDCINTFSIYEETFNGSLGNYTVESGAFSSPNTAYENFTQQSGSVELQVGGADNTTQTNMSLAISTNFTANGIDDYYINIEYILDVAEGYDADEWTQVILNIDDQAVNYNGNNYLSELVAGSPSTTELTSLNIVLNGLSVGMHNLTFGILNNKKTYGTELSTLTINNISINTDCPEICPDYIIESDSSTITNSKSAITGIETNGSILSNSNITYQAGDSIILKTKFEVHEVATFEAKIGDCQ